MRHCVGAHRRQRPSVRVRSCRIDGREDNRVHGLRRNGGPQVMRSGRDKPVGPHRAPVHGLRRIGLRQMQSVCPALPCKFCIICDKNDQPSWASQCDKLVRKPYAALIATGPHDNHRAFRQQPGGSRRIGQALIIGHQDQHRHAPGMRRARVEMRGCAC